MVGNIKGVITLLSNRVDQDPSRHSSLLLGGARVVNKLATVIVPFLVIFISWVLIKIKEQWPVTRWLNGFNESGGGGGVTLSLL